MEYYEILHLKREPFSNSPDPDFFYAAPSCQDSLQMLEIAIRLRRGLNVVLGEVGTGKTTLSRVLLKAFEGEPDRFEIHLLLDPGFQSDREMLDYLLRLLGGEPAEEGTVTQLKDQLQGVLFKKGVQEGKVVVLLVDEGQKLSPSGLEIIRELLNFECNQYKLLQVVVFAQMEFWDRIKGMKNLLDRVNAILRLGPMSVHETRAMIHHRLVQAGMSPDRVLFTEQAVKVIHRAAAGHPRRIINLCHHALLKALVSGRKEVTAQVVRQAKAHMTHGLPLGTRRPTRRGWGWAAALFFLAALVAAAYEFLRPVAPGSSFQGGLSEEPVGAAAEVSPSSPGPGLEEVSAPWEEQVSSLRQEEARSGRVWDGEEWFRLHPEDLEELDSATTVVVRRGETLSAIVERHYGVPLGAQLMRALQMANPGLTNPDRLGTGETLILPRLGGGRKGFHCEPLAWFIDAESAKRWASAASRDKGPLFLVRAKGEGEGLFGVVGNRAGGRDEPPSEGQPRGAFWIDKEDVLRVYDWP